MEYRLIKEDKKVRYNGNYHMKRDKLIGSGEECDAYLIKGRVVKFYKPSCDKERLTKEEALYLSNINTKRILTPSDVLTDKKRKIMGYVMNFYVENLGIDNLLHLNKTVLKEELQLLKKDIVILSKKRIILYDLLIENIAFNNGIYFYDPGSFQFMNFSDLLENVKSFHMGLFSCISKGESIDKIHYFINIERINNCLLMQIFTKAVNEVDSTIDVIALNNKILDEFREKKYPDLLEYFTEEIEEENLEEFILRKK